MVGVKSWNRPPFAMLKIHLHHLSSRSFQSAVVQPSFSLPAYRFHTCVILSAVAKGVRDESIGCVVREFHSLTWNLEESHFF